MCTHTSKFYNLLYDDVEDANQKIRFLKNYITNNQFTIIDIGSGSGHLSFGLASENHKLICFEKEAPLFSVLIEKLKVRSDLKHLLSFFPIDFCDLNKCFSADIIFSSNVMSQIEYSKKLQLFDKAFQNLKSNGKFIFNCVQYLKNRPEQPLSEIHKKIYGSNTIHHIAGSKSMNNKNQFEITYKYLLKHEMEVIAEFSDSVLIEFDSVNQIRETLLKAGFINVDIFGDWEKGSYSADSLGFVVVATK